ncbi:MAG TPA: acyl-CoA dehydrogenase family protein [Gemmatimonadales bacterium]|nr:acyl-CoA dehydrogenase family protein [Gemmatimonadales bacterium]
MEFDWTADQIAFREAVIGFAHKSLRDDVIARDAAGEFNRELWRRCAEFGIQGLPFPEAYGGGGNDPFTAVLALEALGSVCRDNGLLFALAAQMWSVQMPIHRFGSEDQKRRYLTRLCSGEWIGAHGMSEPEAGSDAFSLQTRAERRGDEYVLNGTKTFVSDASVADVFVVFATIDRSLGPLGITGFIVERDSPGLQVSGAIHKMGMRTSPMAELALEDCRVPVANRLGREGRGAQVFNDSMEWERGCILASAVGAMERQLADSITYARQRQQFGAPISQFQAVQHRLVDMKVRLEAARLLLYRAAWSKQHDRDPGPAAAIAKLAISEAWVQSGLHAVQVRGGYGYAVEYEAERDFRDAVGSLLYSGTSDMQRNLIARSLGL